MTFPVFLTDDASRDLEELYDFIQANDSTEKAEYVLSRLEDSFQHLRENPERGGYPDELLVIGIRDYRQIRFKPYRIIYRIIAGRVYIMVIADGRRDMQALLQRRLL